MIHQSNKQFNTYKEGLDLEVLRRYCEEHGEKRTFLRGEVLECEGEPSQWLGHVEKGCFKYSVRNLSEQKDYITGFAFTDEFVADFPNCMEHLCANVSIIAQTTSKVYLIDGKELKRLFEMNNTERKTKYIKEATESSIYEDPKLINIEDSTEVIKHENSNICSLAYSAENSARLAIQELNTIYNTKFAEEVKIGRLTYDAIGVVNGNTHIVECKYIRDVISVNRLLLIYHQVLELKENILQKKPYIIIVFVLENYTDRSSKKIQEYYNTIDPDLKILVLDYKQLKTKFKSIE